MRIFDGTIHFCVCIVFATAFAAHSAEDSSVLEIIGAHASQVSDTDSMLYRVVFRNQGQSAKKIKYLVAPNADSSTRSVGAHDEQILWWRVAPPIIGPHEFGEVRIKLARVGERLSIVRLQCEDGTTETIPLPAKQDDLIVRSVKYDSNDKAFSIYWSHRSNSIQKLTTVQIDGRAVGADINPEGRTAQSNEQRCFSIKLKEPANVGAVRALSLRTDGGLSADVLFRVPPPFSMGIEGSATGLFGSANTWTTRTSIDTAAKTSSISMLASCLTHKPETAQSNAWNFLRRERESFQSYPKELSLIQFCPQDEENGPGLFGEIADAIAINPWSMPLPYHLRRDIKDPKTLLDSVRAGVGTGRVYAIVPVDSPDDERVISRTLLAIVAGCSGVSFRMPTDNLELAERCREALEERMNRFKPVLPLWDNVEPLSAIKTNEPSVAGWLMQMGPRRLSIILIDTAEVIRDRDVTLAFALPEGLHAQRILDFGGEEISRPEKTENKLGMTLSKFRDSAILFIELGKPGGSNDAF